MVGQSMAFDRKADNLALPTISLSPLSDMQSQSQFAPVVPSRMSKASSAEARDLMINSLVHMVQAARPESDRHATLPQLAYEH